MDRPIDDWGSGGAATGTLAVKGKGKKAKGDKPSGANPNLGVQNTHTKNSKGKKICAGFQHGACKGIWLTKANKYDPVCPRNKEERHHCNVCLATDHGSSHCPLKLTKKQRKAQAGKGHGG